MKTALLSVSDKNGITEFASQLVAKGYRLLSTGGTLKHLENDSIEVTAVDQLTNFPEILDGRVKTLHPNIHGGILARNDKPTHLDQLEAFGIKKIDMVVVNLYPFVENADKELSDSELVEFIDIGGPTMLRAAAKSFQDVVVITHTEDYSTVLSELDANGLVCLETRKMLAAKVFNLTSAYDAAIAEKLSAEMFPLYHNSTYKKHSILRYGENPHQKAAFYTKMIGKGAMKDFDQLSGKELSFNNIRDMDIAWKVVMEFTQTVCCAVKHSTPCGVALADTPIEAYLKTHDCDPISIFGGIVAFNSTVDEGLAIKLNEIFLEIVLAPDYTFQALEVLKKKKNLRVIKINSPLGDSIQSINVDGGILVQELDKERAKEFKVVTDIKPSSTQLEDLDFALKVIKHVKSNAIVVASHGQAIGVGTGETNRIWAAQQAISRAKEKRLTGLVMASDAFFPFRDVVDFAAENAIEAIVQPGGSLRDQESIDAANQHGIAMCFTGIRHFLH